MTNREDALIIGYDESSDGAAMSVLRKTKNGMTVVRIITDDKARQLYNILTTSGIWWEEEN